MKKIKVLWVITGGIRRNGICVSQLEYAKRLNKNKFILHLVAVHNNSEDMIQEYKDAGCKVFELPDRRGNIIKYVRAFKKLVKRERYEVVHSFGSSSLMFIELLIAKFCGVKKRIAHSRNTTCDRKKLEKYLKSIFNSSYNYALSCGDDAGKWLFGDRDYCVLHNGKDLSKYSFNENVRKKIRKKYRIDNKIAFGHVGNFNIQKNHNFLIDIFYEIIKDNDDIILFLMGSGEKIDEIKHKVNSLGIKDKVIFLGSINNVEDILQAMDIMLFPSLFEGLPNVVIEWQASGLPCFLSEKITKECRISENVFFMSIDEGVFNWIDKISKFDLKSFNRKKESLHNCELLRKNGFDIEENVKILENIYLDYN